MRDGRVGGGAAGGELGDQAAGHTRGEQGLAVGDDVDGVQQPGRWNWWAPVPLARLIGKG